VRPNPQVLKPEFLNVLSASPYGKRYFLSCSKQSTNLASVNSTQLKQFPVLLPSLCEQEAITRIICCWGDSIEKLEQLIAAKTKLKRGLMQQLLTGRKRFREFEEQEWQSLELSDFAKLSLRPTPKPDKPFKSLGIRSHGKGTFLKEDFEPRKIELTELYEVRENDLIVNITFAWEGAIAIASANDSGALVSHRFPTYVFDTTLAIPEYFRHVIVQKWFVEKLGLISPGGAGRNRVLSKKDFAKLEVLMPSVEEQRKIAAVLNACDRETYLLQKQLAALKKQKQGLMQKLLTGQIRVKVEAETEAGGNDSAA
jgi:type I restriction enzyme, S subunit